MSREKMKDILKTQEVLRERVFDPIIAEVLGMREIIDWVKFQH